MKTIIALVLSIAGVLALHAAEPVITVDLYGNVFLNGENTSQQIGGFARNHPQLAPQVDGAVRAAALAARERIAADIKAATDAAADQVAGAERARDAAIAANAEELADAKGAVVALTASRESVRAELVSERAGRAADISARDTIIAARDAQLAASAEYIATLQKKIRDLGGEVPAAPSS